eukprot:TRINITY_DN46377_c0_g1_i1.p1 TRINITY_DN46377_c0_g1~~TRINITY_DN46377_c0_g1_i1.p1  ORF type:complete len:300 (-),score=52.53 TRINITY_DN46377_c0_g1_i1:158-1033(-)
MSAGNGSGSSPRKRPRLSLEPDVEVLVEDETFKLHSYPLMKASEVFHRMLSSDMQEGTMGRIELAGKSKTEFKEVLKFLESGALIRGKPAEVSANNVKVLLRWANEYMMDGLLWLCEDFLMKQDAGLSELAEALRYGLERRKQQCVEHLTTDVVRIRRSLQELGELCDDPELMAPLWPAVYACAGLSQPKEVSPGSVKALWPFVWKACASVRSLEDVHPGMRVKVACTMDRIKRWGLILPRRAVDSASPSQIAAFFNGVYTVTGKDGTTVLLKQEGSDFIYRVPHDILVRC